MKFGLGGLLVLGVMIGGLLFSTEAAVLASVKVQPLLYEERLKSGEIKKGFIDVANPTSQVLQLETSVEAFKQVDDEGSLEFYESEAVEAGITPDFEEFELKPHQAMRLMFEVDGSKLPSGDVFAALFVSSRGVESAVIQQNVRVGTLLLLENGTPPTRSAEITELTVPIINIGSRIDGSYQVKNTATAGQATGFMPVVSVKIAPFDRSVRIKSSLVFAGRERTNEFSVPFSQLGIYKVTAAYEDSVKSRWVLLLPSWALYASVGLLLVSVGWTVISRRRRTNNQSKQTKTIDVQL